MLLSLIGGMEVITYGGISIVNAIPAMLGGAAAVDLKVKVSFDRGRGCELDPFIGFIVKYVSTRLNKPIPEDLCVAVDSEVPPSSGLKSNSAVAVAVAYGLAKILGIQLSPVDSAKLAAEATRAHGSSITGAFDDASASILGGVVLTDNSSMNVIKQFETSDDYSVVLTGFRSSKRLQNLDRLRALKDVYRAVFEMALKGDLWRAATVNGMFVAEALGYWDALEVVGRAMGMGALASGVSGNGPAIFAVFKHGEEGPFVDYVDFRIGYHIQTHLVNIIHKVT